MDDHSFRERLVGVGEKIKAKGWSSASVDIFVSYLAIFDHGIGPHGPLISCRPSIRASTRDKYAAPTSHEFVRGGFDCKTIEQAMGLLEATALAMPTHDQEVGRIADAKSKLSDDEQRLLGIR